MSELQTIEHSIEEKMHAILHQLEANLHQLEAKLQQVFGSHPEIDVHVATAKAQVSEVVAPGVAQEEAPPAPPAPPAPEE